jgi:hypothetical protein
MHEVSITLSSAHIYAATTVRHNRRPHDVCMGTQNIFAANLCTYMDLKEDQTTKSYYIHHGEISVLERGYGRTLN